MFIYLLAVPGITYAVHPSLPFSPPPLGTAAVPPTCLPNLSRSTQHGVCVCVPYTQSRNKTKGSFHHFLEAVFLIQLQLDLSDSH